MGFPGGADGKESACNAGDSGSILGLGISPGEEMATHSSILAWRIPWTEELGGLYSPWGCKELDMIEQLTHTNTHKKGAISLCLVIILEYQNFKFS